MLIWWKSAVNRSFLLCLATCRMRSSACDTLTRSCARRVLCWLAFPLVPALGSTDSAADGSALFVGFSAVESGRGGAYRPASARSLKRLVQFSRKPLSYVGRADWRKVAVDTPGTRLDQPHEAEVLLMSREDGYSSPGRVPPSFS